jgi:hypothetical protein
MPRETPKLYDVSGSVPSAWERLGRSVTVVGIPAVYVCVAPNLRILDWVQGRTSFFLRQQNSISPWKTARAGCAIGPDILGAL